MIKDFILLFFIFFLYNYTKLIIISHLFKRKIDINKSNIILFLIYNAIILFIGLLVDEGLAVIITCSLSLIFYKFIFSVSLKYSVFKTLLLYLFLELIIIPMQYLITEIIINNYNNHLLFFRSVILLFYTISILILFHRKWFYKVLNTFESLFYNNNIFYIFGCMALLIINILYYLLINLVGNIKFIIMIVTFSLQSIFVIVVLIMIILNNIFLSKREKELEELKNRYNNLEIDYRKFKHNLTNELIAVKCADNKNIKCLIDEIIYKYKKEYDENKLYDTDKKGIEGILDIKLKQAKKHGINIVVDNLVNFDIYDYLECKYLITCDVLGIALDNAIESSLETDEKVIFIDINYINEKLNIKVINNFANKIDVDSLFKFDYSTKNRNSGFGLNFIDNISADEISVNIEIMNSLFIFNIIV